MWASPFVAACLGAALPSCRDGAVTARARPALSRARRPDMDLAALHRTVAVGDNASVLLKVVYDGALTGSMPCVILLSGADCAHESYSWLASRLARAGCAVTLSTCVVPFGPSTCLLSVPFDLSALRGLDEYKRGPSTPGVAAILDELRAITAAADGPLAGRLDLSRLAVGGHSSGGRTALDLAAFDCPFDIGAVFSYGASLVNSGMGDFAPRGSVLACDAATPPPLLLLGGSEDGVSAALSASNDATETLRRTMAEGVARGSGDADLRIVRGANHMVFCDPVDPCCRAVRADRPMGAGADGESIRWLLGSLIVDFLSVHGIARDAAAMEAPIGHDERLLVSDTIRGGVQTTRASESTSTAAGNAGDAGDAGVAGDAGGTDGDGVGDGGSDAEDRAWKALRSALDTRLVQLRAELRLEPSGYAADSATWQAGGLTGSIEGYESPAVAWAVRYANEGDGPTGRAQSVGLNVWLTARLPVPHLTMYVGVRGGRATFMADHLPRHDLGSRPDHVSNFFAGEQAKRWSELQKAEKLRAFRSMDPSVRAVQGPNALALTGDALDPDVIEQLSVELHRHVDTWLSWVRTTALLDESAAAPVEARDRAMRIALREHERAAGERFMGVDVAKMLSASMAGPLPDAPRRAEPLAWRPAARDPDWVVDEVQRFCAAAQREVAGLMANGEPSGAGDEVLQVDVTVHRDFGSFMQSKPSLTRTDDGAVVVGAHAFLEPEWSAFERPLANAPSGVYTYVHEDEQPNPDASVSAAAAIADVLLPTLCLKLKRREAVIGALGGAALGEGGDADRPDAQAAMRVNQLAWRWAVEQGGDAETAGRAARPAKADALALELTDDRELLDNPDGPFGNKGGLYIESRIRLRAAADGAVQVTSPTITTPLAGVPEPFLASHYMKVLCPLSREALSQFVIE